MSLLKVTNLTTRFHTPQGIVHAVENVSLALEPEQTIGIVGESGSGKSVTCYSLLGLIEQPPGKIISGSAVFGKEQVDLLQLSEKRLRQYRGKKISIIFQDPMSSLNPYLRISTQMVEMLTYHQKISKKKALVKSIEMLEQVGVHDATTKIKCYPHEFSGGMQQRVAIAMALLNKPELLICDEPTTALDVVIQKQVLDLIKEQQQKTKMSIIFITHDLNVVKYMCDTIYVMYAGSIVEQAPVAEIFRQPRHAYTRSLMKSMPLQQPKESALYTIPGSPPSLINPPQRCLFAPRNTIGNAELCINSTLPQLIEISSNHYVQDCAGCLS